MVWTLPILYVLLSFYTLFIDYLTLKEHNRVVKAYYERSKHTIVELEQFAKNLIGDEKIQATYLEHTLTSWVLQNRAWHAYHSAMGVHITRGEQEYYFTLDFSPRVTAVVSPVIHPRLLWNVPLLETELIWENQGAVFAWRRSGGYPPKYTTSTDLGKLQVLEFRGLVDWIVEYAGTHREFIPYEIQLPGGQRHIDSSMCHDFSAAAVKVVQRLQSMAVEPAPELFRDRIIVHASEVVLDAEENFEDVIEYYSKLKAAMVNINEDFTFIRKLLAEYQIVPYYYAAGKYYKFIPTAPWANYCYNNINESVKEQRCLFLD